MVKLKKLITNEPEKKRHSDMFHSELKKKLGQIDEEPDSVRTKFGIIKAEDMDARPFLYLRDMDKFFISNKRAYHTLTPTTNPLDLMYDEKGVDVMNYFEKLPQIEKDRILMYVLFKVEINGRLWLDKHIISFWYYPTTQELTKILKHLNNDFNISINSSWKIEVWHYVGSNKIEKVFINKPDITQDRLNGMIVPVLIQIKDYNKSLPMNENIISETPDEVFYDNTEHIYRTNGAYAFGFKEDKNLICYVSDKNETHYDMGYIRSSLLYPGRIWTNHKLISFWEYPPKEKIKECLLLLEKAFNDTHDKTINIYNDPEYKIEVLYSKNNTNKMELEFDNDYSYSLYDLSTKKTFDADTVEKNAEKYGYKVAFVNPKEYGGSLERSSEELAKQHVMSPMLKSKRKPEGWGSTKDSSKSLNPHLNPKLKYGDRAYWGDSVIKMGDLLENTNDMITVYHLTTVENYENIKRDGELDPTKTNKPSKKLEFSDSRDNSLEVLSSFGWAFRRTKGYVLLILEVPKELLSDLKFDMYESNKKISTKYITKVEYIPRPDRNHNVVEKLKKNNIRVYILNLEHMPSTKYVVEVVNNDLKEFPRSTPDTKPFEYHNDEGEFQSEILVTELPKYIYLLKQKGFVIDDNKSIE